MGEVFRRGAACCARAMQRIASSTRSPEPVEGPDPRLAFLGVRPVLSAVEGRSASQTLAKPELDAALRGTGSQPVFVDSDDTPPPHRLARRWRTRVLPTIDDVTRLWRAGSLQESLIMRGRQNPVEAQHSQHFRFGRLPVPSAIGTGAGELFVPKHLRSLRF